MYHHDDHYHDQYSLYTCVYWHEAVPSGHLSVNWVGFAPPSSRLTPCFGSTPPRSFAPKCVRSSRMNRTNMFPRTPVLEQQSISRLIGRSSNGQGSSQGVSRTANCTKLYDGQLRKNWKKHMTRPHMRPRRTNPIPQASHHLWLVSAVSLMDPSAFTRKWPEPSCPSSRATLAAL